MRKAPTTILAAATLLAAVGGASSRAVAGGIDATWTTPALDRWMYPFNATPGTRPVISVFGSEAGGTLFDSRDAQFIIGFHTASQVTPGLGTPSYSIESAKLVLESANDLVVAYDPTSDPWQTFLAPSDPQWQADADPGQPVELFGCGFRNGWTLSSFAENSPFGSGNVMAPGVRNAFAMDFDSAGTPRDVSSNPRQSFQASPFAVGQIASLAPGDLIPIGARMEFAIDVANPAVQRYLAQGLDQGRLMLVASSLTFVVQQGGNFPSFYAKENPLVTIGLASAARLELTVYLGPPCADADLNCDGVVGGTDLTVLLSNWGGTGSGDINGDGVTDGLDLTALLSAWTG